MATRHQDRTWLSHARTAGLIALPAGAAALLAAAWSPVMASGPAVAGEWRFDEPDGQVARDTGPHRLDGQLGTGAEPDASDPARIASLSGGALRFAGDRFVRVPDASELGPPRLTIETVARSDGSPGPYRYIVSRGGQACFAGAYGLYTGEHGGLALYVLDGPRYVVSAAARPADVWDGRWHHVAGTFDGDGLRLYVDGRPVGAPSNGPARIDYAGTAMTTVFGRYVGTCDLPFAGDVDLLRIWSGALSADGVRAAAEREVPPGAQPGPPAPSGPLRAAAPPTRLDADRPGRRGAAGGGRAPACTLSLSRTRIAAGRRTTVRVRVTVRGAPARSVRVVARLRGSNQPIAEARTGKRGRAQLRIRVRRARRVRLEVAAMPKCSPRDIRVTRPDASDP